MTTSESATVVVAVSYSGSIGDEELKKDFKFGLLQIEKSIPSTLAHKLALKRRSDRTRKKLYDVRREARMQSRLSKTFNYLKSKKRGAQRRAVSPLCLVMLMMVTSNSSRCYLIFLKWLKDRAV